MTRDPASRNWLGLVVQSVMPGDLNRMVVAFPPLVLKVMAPVAQL